MASRIPLYMEPDPSNPGKGKIKEVPSGDTVDGMFPMGVLGSHQVASTDGASNPRGGPVGENELVGRAGSANVGGLTFEQAKAILRVVRGSAGVPNAGHLIELDGGGKLSLTLFPDSILNAQSNAGESVSSGNSTPPPSGFSNIFKAVVNGVLQMRGVMSNTPNRVQISESAFDAIINVVTDDSGTDPGALYSAGHIDSLITAVEDMIQTADLVSDTTPELGGNLYLGGFAIRTDLEGIGDLEVLSVQDVAGVATLFLMGQAAVLAILTNIQDGDILVWDSAQGTFVNQAPTSAPNLVAPDRFEALLLAHHNLTPDVEEGMPLGDAGISIASPHWAPAANEGAGVNFERIRYDSTDDTARTYKITFQVSLENADPEILGNVRLKVGKWQSTMGARSDIPGSTRYMGVGLRQSMSITVETTMSDDTEVGLMVLHESTGSETLKFLADACTVKIEQVLYA